MSFGEAFPDGLLERAVEVGAVTDRSVRVWVRQPGSSSVDGTLFVGQAQEARASVELSAEHDWTGALQFELPEAMPKAEFRVEVDGQVRSGRLAPRTGRHTSVTFGFGSCNQPFKLKDDRVVYREAGGIYDAFTADLERAGGRFLLLVGDQFYSDEVEPISVRSVHPEAEALLPTREESVEAYRAITRGYLNVSGFRRLRERFPTCMIWDDHDIFDNWGSRKETSALDRRMFDAATQVYCEYQQLRNPSPQRGELPFDYRFRYGDIGFFVLDTRGMRDWRAGELLGQQQWDDLIAFLDGPESADLSTLFIVSSVPVAHVARWMPMLFEHLPGTLSDAVRDRWSASAYLQERDDLLERLFAWQTASPERQVFILSGDVHVAGAYTIRKRKGAGRIEQLTSSAFTTPLASFDRYLNVIAARGANLFEPRWSFTRHFIKYSNNAGLVRLTALESGGHIVEFLVRGWNRRERRLRTVGRHAAAPDNSGL